MGDRVYVRDDYGGWKQGVVQSMNGGKPRVLVEAAGSVTWDHVRSSAPEGVSPLNKQRAFLLSWDAIRGQLLLNWPTAQQPGGWWGTSGKLTAYSMAGEVVIRM